MPRYKVTLTHQEKVEVESDNPESAVQKAQEQTAGITFEPSKWAVKEEKE